MEGSHGNKLNATARAHVAAILGDAFLSITALVIGILSLTSIIHGISPAAAYFLISVSGYITLTWLLMCCIPKCNPCSSAKSLLRAAVSSKPSQHLHV